MLVSLIITDVCYFTNKTVWVQLSAVKFPSLSGLEGVYFL